MFYIMSLILDSSAVSLMIRLGLWALGKKMTEVKCCPHHITWSVETSNMTYHCHVNHDHLVEVVSVSFLHSRRKSLRTTQT